MLLCDYPPGPAQLGIYDRSSCEVTFGYWTYQIYYRAAFLSTKVRYDHHRKKLNLKGRENYYYYYYYDYYFKKKIPSIASSSFSLSI